MLTIFCLQAHVWLWASHASYVGGQAKEELIPVHTTGNVKSWPLDSEKLLFNSLVAACPDSHGGSNSDSSCLCSPLQCYTHQRLSWTLHRTRPPALHQPCRCLRSRCPPSTFTCSSRLHCRIAWSGLMWHRPSSFNWVQVRGGKQLAAVSTPTSCGLMAPLLEPDTPDSGLSEEHAWRIRVSCHCCLTLRPLAAASWHPHDTRVD